MKSDISCGNRNVLYSETFICADNESDIVINFDFMPEYTLQMRFRWKFINDPSTANGNPHMDIDSEQNEFIFTIYNSDNPFGTGNIHPIPVAMLGKHTAYLYFRFNRPEKGMPRQFTFTLVLDREEAKNER